MLKQAWLEGIKPCLVLNKIDRLVTELKLSAEEAYDQLQKVLEQVCKHTSLVHNILSVRSSLRPSGRRRPLPSPFVAVRRLPSAVHRPLSAVKG